MKQELTQEEKRVKIALATGFKWICDGHEGRWLSPQGVVIDRGRLNGRSEDQTQYDMRYCIPDYFGCLNAMHEAEKTLDSIQWDSYICYLLHEMPPLERQPDRDKDPAHASAGQRAEAFGISKTLW